MINVFVPWNPRPCRSKRSTKVGWITDANGCDIWQGANVKGYGQIHDEGRMRFVHRLRYEREIGPIPEGMQLDHYVCDNGSGGCCNPHHCRPVTLRENTLRSNGLGAINAAKTHCPKGHSLSGDNLVKAYVARGKRDCRICHNARYRAYTAKRALKN